MSNFRLAVLHESQRKEFIIASFRTGQCHPTTYRMNVLIISAYKYNKYAHSAPGYKVHMSTTDCYDIIIDNRTELIHTSLSSHHKSRFLR